MLNRFLSFFSRQTPDPLILAFACCLFVWGSALLVTSRSLPELSQVFSEGLWSLLGFSMQMALVLLLGAVVGRARLVQKALRASFVGTSSDRAVVLRLILISSLMAWINWGLGLVSMGLLAREASSRCQRVGRGFLAASAYAGFIVWHGGLSGSIPLTVNTPGHFADPWTKGVVGLDETLFSIFNLSLIFAVVGVVAITSLWLVPKVPLEESRPEGADSPEDLPSRGLRVERGLLALMGFIIGGASLIHFYQGGSSWGLNLTIAMLVALVLMLYSNAQDLSKALQSEAPLVAGILFQFPIYGGIMALVSRTELGPLWIEGMSGWTSAEFFPVLTFWLSGLLNLLIPSGGGQFAVQAPITLPLALEMGASMPQVLLAISWGDAWTNLIQPFWILPVMAITGLRIRDLMGYGFIYLFTTGTVISLWFWLVGIGLF